MTFILVVFGGFFERSLRLKRRYCLSVFMTMTRPTWRGIRDPEDHRKYIQRVRRRLQHRMVCYVVCRGGLCESEEMKV